MVQGSDAGGGDPQQYLSVRACRLRKVHQLQPFITAEFFCPHCTHINFLFPLHAAVSLLTTSVPASACSSTPVSIFKITSLDSLLREVALVEKPKGTPHRAQIWAAPPSTNSSAPVTKVLSSEARKTPALAISSGVPKRPIGTLFAILANICWPAGPDCASRS